MTSFRASRVLSTVTSCASKIAFFPTEIGADTESPFTPVIWRLSGVLIAALNSMSPPALSSSGAPEAASASIAMLSLSMTESV